MTGQRYKFLPSFLRDDLREEKYRRTSRKGSAMMHIAWFSFEKKGEVFFTSQKATTPTTYRKEKSYLETTCLLTSLWNDAQSEAILQQLPKFRSLQMYEKVEQARRRRSRANDGVMS